MEKRDLKRTEELLEKRFSAVKREIKDPGYIEIEYNKKKKEKKESFFSRPGMQLAGVFLAAIMVGAGTFGALKYIEHKGDQLAGQSGTDPAVTSDPATDGTEKADNTNKSEKYDRLILFIDPDKKDAISYYRNMVGKHAGAIGGIGYDRELEKLGISIEKNLKSTYISYTLTTKYGETGTTKYPGFMTFPDSRDGYPVKVIVMDDYDKDGIKVLYVTEEDAERPKVKIITDDMAGGSFTEELDISALKPYMGDLPYYLYLDFESSVKTAYPDGSSFSKILLKVMYCTGVLSSSKYDCEKAFVVNIVDGEFVLGEEFGDPEIPDLSDMTFTVSSGGDSCRAALIGSYCQDITVNMNGELFAYSDPSSADIPKINYNGTLDLRYDADKTNDLFSWFAVTGVTLYDDSWNIICITGNAEDAMKVLDIKKHSSVNIVIHCAGRDNNSLLSSDMFCYDFAFHVNQWAYDTYDIDLSPLPDIPDREAPVYLYIRPSWRGGKEIPDRLVSIKIPGNKTVYASDEKLYEVYELNAENSDKIELKYDEKAELKNIDIYKDSDSPYDCISCTSEKEMSDAILRLRDDEKLSSCLVTFTFEIKSDKKDAQYDEYTVYTYECSVRFILR